MASTSINTHGFSLQKAIRLAPVVDSVSLYRYGNEGYCLVVKMISDTVSIALFTEVFNDLDAIKNLRILDHFSDDTGL